jgi:hypothetical protein
MTESWQLRTHMIFIVDNLQHYLMADVLESQYSMLMKKLDHSTNFEEIRHSHDVFLSTVIAHTFINNKSVNHCLSELLKVCQQYCDYINGVNTTISKDDKNPDKFVANLVPVVLLWMEVNNLKSNPDCLEKFKAKLATNLSGFLSSFDIVVFTPLI